MELHEAPAPSNQSNFLRLWWQDCRQITGLQRRTLLGPSPPRRPLHSPSHLLAFGVAGGGIGLRVVLPLEGALKGLEVVLAEGVRAEMLAGPTAAALGVDAQPAAVLVTWGPQAGRKLSGDPSTHPQAQVEGQTELQRREGPRAQASGPQGCGHSETGHVLQANSCQNNTFLGPTGLWPIGA